MVKVLRYWPFAVQTCQSCRYQAACHAHQSHKSRSWPQAWTLPAQKVRVLFGMAHEWTTLPQERPVFYSFLGDQKWSLLLSFQPGSFTRGDSCSFSPWLHTRSIPSFPLCCWLLWVVVGCCRLWFPKLLVAGYDVQPWLATVDRGKDHRYDSLTVVKSGNTAGLPRAEADGGPWLFPVPLKFLSQHSWDKYTI